MALRMARQPYYPVRQMGMMGMGGACCDSCKHGGSCDSKRKGMGLFDSGMDYTQWGVGEWATVAIGGYALFSMFFTTKRAVRRVGEFPDDVRAGVKRSRKRLAKRIAG